ncbi:MAG TPA: cupin domain-containing protein [Ktedonobacterales bacterium]|nr:cupin domain-containing protein [Ktedonobacterales bacterium]
MRAFELADLLATQRSGDTLYHEFLREPALSMGLYVLPAGGTDPQRPHTEDEVYYIARGRGMITVGEEQRAVMAGAVVYVPARVEHRFHSVAEELQILVFFAPAEYSQAGGAGAEG